MPKLKLYVYTKTVKVVNETTIVEIDNVKDAIDLIKDRDALINEIFNLKNERILDNEEEEEIRITGCKLIECDDCDKTTSEYAGLHYKYKELNLDECEKLLKEQGVDNE